MCVCVLGGGSSDFFQSKLQLSEIPGGPTHMLSGGGGVGGGGEGGGGRGGGLKLFSKGVESNC